MGVFDIDDLKSDKQNQHERQEECIDWCTQAVSEFAQTARELGLEHITLKLYSGQKSPLKTKKRELFVNR